MRPRSRPLIERFEEKVFRCPMSGCWLWTGAVSSCGYGQIWSKGKRWVASRMAWKMRHGDFPDNVLVCHRCDNPACVNPDHLFLGDMKSNIGDAVSKKRLFAQRQTHCRKGHELSPRPGTNKRMCRVCSNESKHKHDLKRRAKPWQAARKWLEGAK